MRQSARLGLRYHKLTRDNAAVAEQLKAALSQMTRDNAAVAEQLRATQEHRATRTNGSAYRHQSAA